ncbi:MAG: IS5 family transposase [Sphingomonadaceae bacterium]
METDLARRTIKQLNLSTTGFEKMPLRTRRRESFEEVDQIVPWGDLVVLIAPHAPKGGDPKGGRTPFPAESMLRIQQWYTLSDPAMAEVLHDIPFYRNLSGPNAAQSRLSSESTILKFRHLLEEHKLTKQILQTINAKLANQSLLLNARTAVDVTLIAAPNPTRNKTGERDSEMLQTKKGNQWHFGMKAHVDVDSDSGLVHSVVGSAASVNDVTQAHASCMCEECHVFADAGYQGVEKHAYTQDIKAKWLVAMKPGKQRALDKSTLLCELINLLEKTKAGIRVKAEHPFLVPRRQFGHEKMRCRGLVKNTVRPKAPCAL